MFKNPYRCDPDYALTPALLRSRIRFLKNWMDTRFLGLKVLDIGELNSLGQALKNRLGIKNMDNTEGDLNKYIVPRDKYDVIFCFEVVEHLQNPLSFLHTLSNRLKPGGKLYLTTPKVSLRLLKMSDHFHELSKSELLNLFNFCGGFKIIKFGTTKSNYPWLIFWHGFRPFLRALMQKSFYVEAIKE